MQDRPEADAFEKSVRFACGFAVGGLVSFLIVLRESTAFTASSWAVVAGISLGSGLFAARWGDRFWHGISDWFRWW